MSADRLENVTQRIQNAATAAGRPEPALLAVSKTQPAAAVEALARAGQRAFGENYVQEAAAKRQALAATLPGLEWHLIGHLQSNKAAQAAEVFDWVQSLDRPSLVAPLARHRAPARGRLNVLIQVNVEGEPGKSGCRPEDLPVLAAAVAAQPMLALRGLMAIPVPHEDPELRRPAFRRMRGLFEQLAGSHAGIDTLSMGMSDDFAIAIAEGATLVRIGTALFGPRPAK
ncbi:YggS family pyridoxal phosphate-dependent enzyme [Pseudoxanthomonas koreensis]|uniref:YggS family pyridoxal phosphate-dependent enzyme n=1 Tax=Pseudoxanthomonas koreensis TaxID=266061 RepID=UPI0013913D18|nr:YggS family pyridoxal phosphate-dependent enzyme [Pseudoxanthomonas koreensis]KAF1690206.1 YggS family pyridoxal phosphate-dependent enzyme [Pseudoxanthomonas koreensis]